MQHMIFMKEMAWVICLTYCEDLKKKLSEFILFLKKLMEPLQIAFLELLHLYVPVQCTCRWIWYFFLFFNGVGSLDTSYWYDRQRQVLRINSIPSLQYVINSLIDAWFQQLFHTAKKTEYKFVKEHYPRLDIELHGVDINAVIHIIKHLNCVLTFSFYFVLGVSLLYRTGQSF